jgi:hypothetical protein
MSSTAPAACGWGTLGANGRVLKGWSYKMLND